MQAFVHEQHAQRVVFGSGTRGQLAQEAARIGCKRLLVLATPRQRELADQMVHLLGDLAVGVFPEATMHTPVDVTERALVYAREVGADGIVAAGGGSTTGLGKAIALRTDLPQIVLPTTYAGSEMTPLIGETRDGLKTTQRTLKVLPEVVIYDVELTLGLSHEMSATSALNAMAHAAEALYAQDGNPVVSLVAEEGVRAIAEGLGRLRGEQRDPADADMRAGLLYGAWLCGRCLGEVGMGLHHKLCHTLGGLFDLPHAEMHAILLPYVLDFNTPAIPDALARMGRALGSADPVRSLLQLQRGLRIPLALRDIGMPEGGISQAVTQTMAHSYLNPRPLDPALLDVLLRRAWWGDTNAAGAAAGAP